VRYITYVANITRVDDVAHCDDVFHESQLVVDRQGYACFFRGFDKGDCIAQCFAEWFFDEEMDTFFNCGEDYVMAHCRGC